LDGTDVTDQQFAELLQMGHEVPGIECKAPGPRADAHLFAKVVRAALGMANRRDGGVVVIGVTDTGTTLEPTGLLTEDLATWNHDEIADGFKTYAEPGIAFTRDVRQWGGRSFVVLSVRPFEEVPVFCKRTYQPPSTKGFVLRDGALYVRSRTKAETVEATSYADMRDLIELATERRLRAFLGTASAAGVDLQRLTVTTDDAHFAGERMPPTAGSAASVVTRGWWEVTIRPTRYQAARVPSLENLNVLLEKCRVELRGWDFPHIDRQRPVARGLNCIEQSFEWEHYLEWWRFLQSGQLAFRGAIGADWRDRSRLWPAPAHWQHGTTLGAGDTLYFVTEVFEFAARLAANLAGDDPLRIEITAHRMCDRELADDSGQGRILRQYNAGIDDMPYSVLLPRADLIATPRDLAITSARWLFERFHWDASVDVLRTWQGELRR
jgi:hypothetical protein